MGELKAKLKEIEGVKYLTVLPGTRMIIGIAAEHVEIEHCLPMFSEEQIEEFKKAGVCTNIPIFLVPNTSDFKLFQIECPVCRMFLDATHKEETVAEAR